LPHSSLFNESVFAVHPSVALKRYLVAINDNQEATNSLATNTSFCSLQGRGEIIPGLEEVLEGMRPGGKRRALIPPELGYATNPNAAQPQPPTFATKRQLLNHAKEPLLFEVQLLKVKGSVTA
jgi:hypothetical protein